jgi:hypothetical protein
MRRLLCVAALIVCAAPAAAQDVPEPTRKDFWCGIAFDMAARDVPADAAAEVLSVTDPYKKGAQTLIDRSRPVYLESGYTEEAFDALRAETETAIAAELASTDPALRPDYSFEDCAALLGL